jgi:very-short-patch-repair endonuclease
MAYVSNLEMEFVNALETALGEYIPYTYKTKQFSIWNKQRGILFYDVCCSRRNKILEINGDYWHANPAKYDADWINRSTLLSATDIWNLDSQKLISARDRGFEVMVIWESDIRANTTEALDAATRFFNS